MRPQKRETKMKQGAKRGRKRSTPRDNLIALLIVFQRSASYRVAYTHHNGASAGKAQYSLRSAEQLSGARLGTSAGFKSVEIHLAVMQ